MGVGFRGNCRICGNLARGKTFEKKGICAVCNKYSGKRRSVRYCMRCWRTIHGGNKLDVCFRCAKIVMPIRNAPYIGEAEPEELPRFKAISVVALSLEEDPEKPERIAYYAQRAELDLPLFDGTPYCGPLFKRKEIA